MDRNYWADLVRAQLSGGRLIQADVNEVSSRRLKAAVLLALDGHASTEWLTTTLDDLSLRQLLQDSNVDAAFLQRFPVELKRLLGSRYEELRRVRESDVAVSLHAASTSEVISSLRVVAGFEGVSQQQWTVMRRARGVVVNHCSDINNVIEILLSVRLLEREDLEAPAAACLDQLRPKVSTEVAAALDPVDGVQGVERLDLVALLAEDSSKVDVRVRREAADAARLLVKELARGREEFYQSQPGGLSELLAIGLASNRFLGSSGFSEGLLQSLANVYLSGGRIPDLVSEADWSAFIVWAAAATRLGIYTDLHPMKPRGGTIEGMAEGLLDLLQQEGGCSDVYAALGTAFRGGAWRSGNAVAQLIILEVAYRCGAPELQNYAREMIGSLGGSDGLQATDPARARVRAELSMMLGATVNAEAAHICQRAKIRRPGDWKDSLGLDLGGMVWGTSWWCGDPARRGTLLDELLEWRGTS